ncbi:hypothetical protein PV413_36055, partial [Streptomyces scabiei]|nr:hypothetical protein [Streptomyces scabiei]MDX3158727.1 hypothetical protein [Streptomyces scabiei]
MALIDDDRFEEFFEPYAKNVDHFYEASYWRLCDEVIREPGPRRLPGSPRPGPVDHAGGPRKQMNTAPVDHG